MLYAHHASQLNNKGLLLMGFIKQTTAIYKNDMSLAKRSLTHSKRSVSSRNGAREQTARSVPLKQIGCYYPLLMISSNKSYRLTRYSVKSTAHTPRTVLFFCGPTYFLQL